MMHGNNLWQAELLRFTLFFSPESADKWSNFWRDLTGADPETVTHNRPASQTIEHGKWENKGLTCTRGIDRLDVLLQDAEAQFGFPSVGMFIPSAKAFLDLVKAALTLRSLTEVTRIAFGAILIHPTKDKNESYQTLADFLPHLQIELDSTDFMYQINKPRPSEISPGISINCLTRWAGIEVKLFEISDKGVGSVITQSAVRLELDINSRIDSTFSAEQPLSDENIDELGEIALKLSVPKGDESDSI